MDVPNLLVQGPSIRPESGSKIILKIDDLPTQAPWGSGHISSIFYLDDILRWSNSQKLALQHMNLALAIIYLLGFLINEKVSFLPLSEPGVAGPGLAHTGSNPKPISAQTGIHPGSNDKPFEERVFSPDILAEAIRFSELCLPGIPLKRLRFRALIFLQPSRDSKNLRSYSTLLFIWHFHGGLTLGISPRVPLASSTPILIVWRDASNKACGLVSNKGDKAQDVWSQEDFRLHITAKELKAVQFLLDQPWVRNLSQSS